MAILEDSRSTYPDQLPIVVPPYDNLASTAHVFNVGTVPTAVLPHDPDRISNIAAKAPIGVVIAVVHPAEAIIVTVITKA
jgi:hypothetical protein